MSLYLDASFVVALVVPDIFSKRAEEFLSRADDVLVVSNFAAAEFVSVISRRVRTKTFTLDHARTALSDFDGWRARATRRVQATSADIALADTYLRRLDLTLLTPDAIHIAVARRIDATLVTFDRRMVTAARALGVGVGEA